MPDPTPVEPRKSPRQARSKATVDALVEATARVLVEDGFDKASTNRIAKVAGVSIGSLYQYFPNKEALVLAVVDRHLDQVAGLIATLAGELADAPVDRAVRATIDALVAAHRLDPELHAALEEQVHHIGHTRIRQMRARITDLITAWLHTRRADVAPRDLEAAGFVLNVGVEAVTHELMVEDWDDARKQAVLDELTDMVLRYLAG